MTIPFQPGDRVYHAALGCFGTWLELVPVSEGVPTYSRIELEDCNGRRMLTPTTELQPAEREG